MAGDRERQAVEAAAPRFDAWVWRRIVAGPEPDLVTTYRELHTPHQAEALTVATVIAQTDPLRRMDGRTGLWRSWYASAGGVGALLVRDDHEQVFVVSSWPDARPGVYHLAATVPSTDRRWLKVDRWLGAQAPDVVPVYLDRSDFEGFVTILGEYGDVDASRLTGRYRTDHSSYSRGWPNPKAARVALEEIADEVQLRTMTLSVLAADATVALRVHLRRNAGATFYSGDFGLFQSAVIDRLAASADRRARLLANRSREVGDLELRPLTVRVGLARFADIASTSDFIDRVSQYANSEAAVLHRNPYVQVALTDYLDGSSFDLVVTKADEITIFPGYRASVGSLARVADFLSEEFEADGVVDAAARSRPSLEELFG